MSNKSFFVLSGWSAILSVVFSFGMFALVGGGRGGAFLVMSIIASVFSALALCGVYLFHRSQSATVSLVMLACGVLGLILETIGNGPETTLGVITNIIYGIAFLLVGYLGLGSTQMPRWISICACVVGASCVVFAVSNALGQATLGGVAEMLQLVSWIAWSVGILITFSFLKTAPVTA